MQDFRKLEVWKRNHALTLGVYQATRAFPREELFGLTSQMRRAAVSVGSNIAEGCCRGSDADFARFLQIGLGSAGELENLILVASDLHLLRPPNASQLDADVTTIKRMLSGLVRRLRS
jgi:four helix bundle protein